MDKKELKKQYLKTIPPMGVYRISNLVTGKFYIGVSKNLHAAFNSAKLQLKLGSFRNPELQCDFSLLGEDQFRFEVLDYLQPKDDEHADYNGDLKQLEALWLAELQPYDDKGYNKRRYPDSEK